MTSSVITVVSLSYPLHIGPCGPYQPSLLELWLSMTFIEPVSMVVVVATECALKKCERYLKREQRLKLTHVPSKGICLAIDTQRQSVTISSAHDPL